MLAAVLSGADAASVTGRTTTPGARLGACVAENETITPHEFIRRFLMRVLPRGFPRIRHPARLQARA
jgi:hypothetical protein